MRASREVETAPRSRPWLRFGVTFAALLLGFECVFRGWLIDSETFAAYRRVLAHLAGGLLALLGQEARVHGTLLTSATASFEVVPGCAAVETTAFLCIAVLATPVPMRHRLFGVLLGVVVMFAANLVRIASLVVLHELSRRADLVTLAHHGVWPMILTALSVALWIAWVRRAATSAAASIKVLP